MRASRPECIEKPKVDGCQTWVFRFVKLVYRLGGVYFILARSDSCAVAQNSLTQNKIYTPSPLCRICARARGSPVQGELLFGLIQTE